MMTNYLIRGFELYKIYENSGMETAILKGISLTVYEGEKLVLIGPSGSGKTTLLDVLIGKIKPNAGQVFWQNHNSDITKLSQNDITNLRREFIGYIDQKNHLLPQLTVRENVLLSKIFQIEYQDEIDYFHKITSMIEIDHLLDRKPSEISIGEKKRVNIAAALINKPKILIADEPVEGLDPLTKSKVLDLFDLINSELQTTIILTTHDQSVAIRGDRILELDYGILKGAHDRTISLAELEKTRKIVVDASGRIKLPKAVLTQLGDKRTLKMLLEEDRIILTWTDDDRSLIQKDEFFICINCQQLRPNKFCTICNSETIKVKN